MKKNCENKKSSSLKAFSLIELSIVILIIGILVAGITQSSRLVNAFRLTTAQNLTQSSPVAGIKDLMLWYETSLNSSFIASEAQDSSDVSTWYDNNPQSTNKINATATDKPKFFENAFGSIPGIRFNGTSSLMLFDGSALIGSDYTIFVVEQKRATLTLGFFIGGSTVNNNNQLHLGWRSDTVVSQDHYSNGFDYTNANLAYSAPTPRIHTFRFGKTSGVGKSYWLNGGTSPEASNTSQTTALSSYTGASLGRMNNNTNNFYNGDLAEIIIFTRSLKNEERQAIETYLGKKYAITIS